MASRSCHDLLQPGPEPGAGPGDLCGGHDGPVPLDVRLQALQAVVVDPADVTLQLPLEVVIQKIRIRRVGRPHLGWPEVGDIGLQEGQAPLGHVTGGGVLLESVGLTHCHLNHPWHHHGLQHIQVYLGVHPLSWLEEECGHDVALVGDHPQGHY